MAKDYQKTRSGLVAINKDQNIVSAGDLSRTKQDVSLWSGKGGLLHNKGWAVCDGSTYDPLVFPELDAALGNPVSKVVPNGPYRTVEYDLTFNDTPPGWSLNFAKGIAYTDTEGNWRLTFNIGATATNFTNQNVNIDGITFANDQSIVSTNTGPTPSNGTAAFVFGGSASVEIRHESLNSAFIVSGNVSLASKPTWADANLEDYPIIATANNVLSNSLGLPEATSQGAGLLTLDQNAEGNKNYIINGGFDFWQRGTSHLTEGYGSADRFRLGLSGGSCTVLQQTFTSNQTDVPGFPKHYLQFDVISGNDNLRLDTRLEDLRNFAGKTFTLSFWAKGTNPGGGSLFTTIDARYGAAGTNFSFVNNEYQVSASWQKFTFTFDVPELDGTALDDTSCLIVNVINQYADASTDAYQVDIAQVKLEEGSQASKFTRAGGTFAGELALCQRYYFKLGDRIWGCMIADNSVLRRTNIVFPNQMRSLQMISFTTSSGSNQSVQYNSKGDCSLSWDAPTAGAASSVVTFSADAEL